MSKLRSLIIITTTIGLLSGCAGPISKTDLESIHTIGVLNSFPDSPTWTVIGTTIFTNKISTAEPRGYKALLSQITIDHIKSKGYKVKELLDKDSTPDDDINFRIELSPWDAEAYIHTKGYGFVQRSFMGMKTGPFAYVVMHIVPRTRRDSGFGQFGRNSYYHEQFESLPIGEMPASWDDLSTAEKAELEKILKKCIEKALEVQLPKLGL